MLKMLVSRLGSMAGASIAGASLAAGASAAEIAAAVSLLLGVGIDTIVRRFMGER